MSTDLMNERLKEEAFEATLRLYLYRLTDDPRDFVSVADRERNVMAFRVSGKPISALTPDDFAVVSLEAESADADAAFHLSLYRRIPGICSIAVVRSRYAAALAKTGRAVRSCSAAEGYFDGDVPCLDPADESDPAARMAETLTGAHVKAMLLPEGCAVLPADDPMEAVDAAVTLEMLAERTYFADRMNEKYRSESAPPEPLHKRLMRAAEQSKKS